MTTEFDFIEQLAPGVLGYTVETDNGLYVPVIQSSDEGRGNVGRYLDSLPIDQRVVVPNVINPILEGMLIRRGFVLVKEWSEQMDEMVPCWERQPV